MSTDKTDIQPSKKRTRNHLLWFLRKEANENWYLLGVANGVLGMSGAILLALVNAGARSASQAEHSFFLAFLFIIALALQAWLQWFVLTRTAAAVEDAIRRVKVRLIDKLRRSSLQFIESRGGIAAYVPLTQIGVISQGTVFLVGSAQVILVLLFVFLYLAWLSPLSLLAILLILAVCVPVMMGGYRVARELLQRAAAGEGNFTRRFTDVLNGFKDVRADRVLSDGLVNDLSLSSANALESKTQAAVRQVEDMNFSFSIFIIMMFAVVFVVPILVTETSTLIHQVSTVVLSLSAPIGLLGMVSPMLSQFDAAVGSLYALEEELDQAVEEADGLSPHQELKHFETIEFDAVRFQYDNSDTSDNTFGIGPVSFKLHSGEMLFIVGGNGSGKSTLLKLLTGLYHPGEGKIRLDGQPLLGKERPAYRTLFACVFTDFHLFERLYQDDEEKVNAGLEELGLAKKTRYTKDGFTNLALSTGQRKRIALLAALLKERPVYVLDELAADQDPAFRKHFYEQMLPDLKAKGHTLICVTHDDQYFHVADRVLSVRDGQLHPYEAL